jgi:hypothetical protein
LMCTLIICPSCSVSSRAYSFCEWIVSMRFIKSMISSPTIWIYKRVALNVF